MLKNTLCIWTGCGELRQSHLGVIELQQQFWEMGDQEKSKTKLNKKQLQYPSRCLSCDIGYALQNVSETGTKWTVHRRIWDGRVKGSLTHFSFESGGSHYQLKWAGSLRRWRWIHAGTRPGNALLMGSSEWRTGPWLEFLGGYWELDLHQRLATVKP